ncbi:uncharacterized protein TNCV_1436371 [Trichonephila clavipes]|nr:uncharacterized protein TNCV_1436371 [Trichonephila clavipes]
MDRFTNAELADMHLMYGAAQGNGAAAERMRGTGIGRYRRTPSLEQRILNTVDNNPSTSSRAVGRALGESHQSVLRTLHEDRMHPYHLQRVQTITPDDYPRRLNFATWYLQQTAGNQTFPADVLFTDEATFTRSGMFNMHNSHLWEHVNPHGTITHDYQERFSINVWAGIVHNNLVGPYILHSRLIGRTYNIFLQEVLPELFWSMFLHLCAAEYGFSTMELQVISPEMSRITWILSTASIGLDESPVTSAEDLVARLSVAAGHVIDMPDVISDLSRSMRRRCKCCVTVGGRTFEHLLTQGLGTTPLRVKEDIEDVSSELGIDG